MRIMGIDYGDRRIGIAVTDPLGFTAQGVATLTNSKKTLADDLKSCLINTIPKKLYSGFRKIWTARSVFVQTPHMNLRTF